LPIWAKKEYLSGNGVAAFIAAGGVAGRSLHVRIIYVG
jgi:hypothetical protein